MSASVWKRNSLGKIGNFSNGVNKPKEAFGHGTKFVNISDVFLPSLKIRDLDKVEISDNEKSFYGLKKDDLLFVRSSVKPDGVGYNTIFEDSNEDIVFCGFVIRFRKSSYEIDAHFLNFLLRSPEYRKQIISFSTVSANTNINQVSLKRIEIEYPQDIKEQKHISDILSTCDTVIQNTQKTIDKYKAIKQGMMQDLFTRGLTKDGKLRPSYKEASELYKESELGMIPKEWEVKALNEIYSKVTNAFVGTATPYYVESGHFYLESNNVKNGFINFNNKIFINDYFYEKQKNNLLHTGDLVMVQSGHVGHTAVIPEELNNTAAHAVIIIANPKIDASPYFYNYYFFSENAINMISKVTKGNTIKHILSSEMKNFKVCYPKMEEQLAIAKRLSSIDSTIQKEETILAKYKKIKTGLMARLLTPPEDAEIIDETGE
jgi:type I restriction enzyme S subunit